MHLTWVIQYSMKG